MKKNLWQPPSGLQHAHFWTIHAPSVNVIKIPAQLQLFGEEFGRGVSESEVKKNKYIKIKIKIKNKINARGRNASTTIYKTRIAIVS